MPQDSYCDIRSDPHRRHIQLAFPVIRMALRFKLDEGLTAGTRRMARSQLAIAIRRLKHGDDPERDVHEARKSLKRTRALLRLVRYGLPAGVFERENRKLAAIGRSLSSMRDLHVLLKTVAQFEPSSNGSSPPVLEDLRHRITDLIAARKSGHDASAVPKAIHTLAAARKRLSAIEVRGGEKVLRKGLAHTHRAGRQALEQAVAKPGTESLHELRKQAQHHWRQMGLLHAAWPQAMAVRAAAARELSQLLGDEHDLAILQLACRKGRPLALAGPERRWLDELCALRRAELQRLIEPLARRLFAASPSVFAEAAAAQWRMARLHPEIAVQEDITAPDTPDPALPPPPEATRH